MRDVVALTAEVERLRPVVEAARAYRLSEIAYDAEIDRQRAFPDSAVNFQVSRDFDDTTVDLAKVVDASLAAEQLEILASKEGEAK